MKVKQLSLFLENKPGALSRPVKLLAKARLNILTLSIADTQQFGIVRLIVEEWQRARDALEKAGFVVHVREVVAATVPDRPGGMLETLELVQKTGVNIEYMYAFTCKRGDKAVVVFRFDDPDKAIAALKAAGQEVLGSNELFR